MNKRQIIIDLFSSSPEAWTQKQLETLKQKTGENIIRLDLRRAYNVKNSVLYKSILSALNEAIQTAYKADFDGRLYILLSDILPALEALEEQRKHIESLTGGPAAYQARADHNSPET